MLGENIGECHTCIIGNWAAVGSDGYVEEKGSNNTSRALDELAITRVVNPEELRDFSSLRFIK